MLLLQSPRAPPEPEWNSYLGPRALLKETDINHAWLDWWGTRRVSCVIEMKIKLDNMFPGISVFLVLVYLFYIRHFGVSEMVASRQDTEAGRG